MGGQRGRFLFVRTQRANVPPLGTHKARVSLVGSDDTPTQPPSLKKYTQAIYNLGREECS